MIMICDGILFVESSFQMEYTVIVGGFEYEMVYIKFCDD